MSVGVRFAPTRMALLVVLLSAMRLTHAVAASAADERAVRSLWTIQASTTNDHAAVLAACEAFKQSYPVSPFGVVADTLGAWHLLKLGRTAEAATRLETIPRRSQESVTRGAYELAAAWLTRIDIARVQQALQLYYRREIGYPSTLADLAAYPKLATPQLFPLVDRWGLRWDYKLVGYRRLTGLRNQKYALRSQKLGAGSGLKEALAVPYGSQITLRMLRVRSTTPGREVVEMEIVSIPAAAADGVTLPPRRHTVMAGVNTWSDGVFLAYVGRQVILVCDRSHWKVFPRPGVRR